MTRSRGEASYVERPDIEPMTRDQLAERVEWWRSRVVPEWRVALNDDPPPGHDMDDVAGVCQTDWTIGEIRIHFPDDTLTLDDLRLDRVTVHELLHGPLDHVLDHDEMLREHVAPTLFAAYKEARNDDMEQHNDRMARLIVDAVHGESSFGTRWAATEADDAKDVADEAGEPARDDDSSTVLEIRPKGDAYEVVQRGHRRGRNAPSVLAALVTAGKLLDQIGGTGTVRTFNAAGKIVQEDAYTAEPDTPAERD